MCTTRFLYYFSVYVNLFKELFLYVACRCISEKRVQRYRLFRYPPNISRIIFQKCLIIDLYQVDKTDSSHYVTAYATQEHNRAKASRNRKSIMATRSR